MNYDSLIERLLDLAIEEDIATGDISTEAIIPVHSQAVAEMKAKADGVISGLKIIKRVYERFEKDIRWEPLVEDGTAVKKGDIILRIGCSYRTLLLGERLSLNILQRMSGIATATAAFVKELEGTIVPHDTVIDELRAMASEQNIESEDLANKLVNTLGSTYFRPYSSTDIITPQICGALKNVFAIAAGIVEGHNLGDNARAALIARGLSEMARFAKALGGHMHTVLGLSGVGDLVLTASSKQSRNYALGLEIGRLGRAKPILENSTKTVEGVATTQAVMKRAAALGLDMPICQVLDKILFHDATLDEGLNDLLLRTFKSENMY